MTEAEAKEYMENEILCIRKAEVCDRDCGKCELVKETGPLLEAYDMAKTALEKQIAKKPIDKLMYIECPACGGVGIEDCAYCSDCGQKLDWSEV